MAIKFLKSVSPPVSLVDMLHERIGGSEASRGFSVIHASQLTKDKEFCAREVRLYDVTGEQIPPQLVNTAWRVTYDTGRWAQSYVTEKLGNAVVGPWRTWGGGSVWGFRPGTEWDYSEPEFYHRDMNLVGSVDLLVDVGAPGLRVVESKIMKQDMLKDLKAPLAEHRIRTQLYLRLIEESIHEKKADIDTDRATVLYIMRGHGYKDAKGRITPFKEFEVEADHDAVEPYFEKVRSVTKTRGAGIMPHRICESPMGVRARACSMAQWCFSDKYPPTEVDDG